MPTNALKPILNNFAIRLIKNNDSPRTPNVTKYSQGSYLPSWRLLSLREVNPFSKRSWSLQMERFSIYIVERLLRLCGERSLS